MSHNRHLRGGVWVDAGFYRRLADLAAERVPLVVVTVTEASGSAPGKPGAKMIVTADSTHDTVGGGRVENAAIQRARELIGSTAGPESVHYDVVQDLGMSCGGSMTLMFEPVTPAPRLVIFGAGHISKPLCAIAAIAGFEVTVCDDRPEWLTAERFPDANACVLADWEDAVAEAGIDAQTFVASVSPGHAFDTRVVRAILTSGARPRYLGVVGSLRKAITLKRELVEAGLDAEAVARIHSPMGIDIGAVEPREIALSAVAEMVAELRNVLGGKAAPETP